MCELGFCFKFVYFQAYHVILLFTMRHSGSPPWTLWDCMGTTCTKGCIATLITVCSCPLAEVATQSFGDYLFPRSVETAYREFF